MRAYSIILPVRNGGSYLKDCVRSILSQDYPNFELIILENASNDGTAEWLETQTDPRVSVIAAKKPLTIEENWARIALIQKREFITLIGHDDLLAPDFLTTMDDLIAKSPGAGLYQCHYKFIDKEGKDIRSCLPMNDYYSAESLLASILLKRIDIMGTGFVMRSADYDSFGGLPDYPNLLFADFELFMNLSTRGGLAVSDQSKFSFRLHESTTKVSSDFKMQAGFERFVYYLNGLKRNPNLDAIIVNHAAAFVQTYCKGLSHRMLRNSIEQREGFTVAQYLVKCRNYVKILTGDDRYNPESDWSVKLARYIDSSAWSRAMFMTFKKIFPKSFLK